LLFLRHLKLFAGEKARNSERSPGIRVARKGCLNVGASDYRDQSAHKEKKRWYFDPKEMPTEQEKRGRKGEKEDMKRGEELLKKKQYEALDRDCTNFQFPTSPISGKEGEGKMGRCWVRGRRHIKHRYQKADFEADSIS